MQIDEQELFEAYFRGHAARVHAFALRRADPEVAQDVTAETFLIAWRRRAQMPLEPLPWLYGIARGVLANERRAANRRRALTARIALQTPAAGTPTGAESAIIEALGALRESDREALLLSAWEGLSMREAASVSGCSAATFAMRLHRARRRLAGVLRERERAADPARCSGPLPEASA